MADQRPATRANKSAHPKPAAAAPRVKAGDEVPVWLKKAIARFFAWAVMLGIAYWVLLKLHSLIIMFVVALFLSLAMEPPVNALAKRGWRRGSATGLVVGGFVVITLGLVIAFGSVAFTQASEIVNNASKYVHDAVDFLNGDLGLSIDARGLIRDLKSPNGEVAQFAKDLANSAPDLLLKLGEALLQIVTTLVFAFYLTADGPRFRRAICSRLRPDRQEMVLDTWEVAVEKTGAYLYSRALMAGISTGFTWLFLFLLGVPSALALAIWVGVVSQFIPTVGTYIAMLLPMLVALVNNPIDALWIAVYLTGYNQFENYVLMPRITRTTLKVHPAVTIGSVFAGGLLFGAVGAVLALPATAVIQALISTYTDEQEVIENELTEEQSEPTAHRRRFRIPKFSFRRGSQVTPRRKKPSSG
jgi:predicted PurR-regulated permease PerM